MRAPLNVSSLRRDLFCDTIAPAAAAFFLQPRAAT
jgi:hypothetical protein